MILRNLFLLLITILLSGCNVTKKSDYIAYLHEKSSRSESCDQDWSYGIFSIDPLELYWIEDNVYREVGPYRIVVNVKISEKAGFGRPSDINIKRAEIVIIYVDKSEQIDVSDDSKWKKSKYDSYSKNKPIPYIGSLYRIDSIDIDFKNLKEVHFNIEYEGVYEDGTVRQYWKKNVAVPNYVEKTFNPSITALMGV